MDITEIRNNIELLPDVIYALEESYLKEKAQMDYMKDLTKHFLAKWKSEYLGTAAEKERLAMAKPEYKVHIEGIKEQANVVAQKGSDFHREERRFEAMRSLNKNV